MYTVCMLMKSDIFYVRMYVQLFVVGSVLSVTIYFQVDELCQRVNQRS